VVQLPCYDDRVVLVLVLDVIRLSKTQPFTVHDFTKFNSATITSQDFTFPVCCKSFTFSTRPNIVKLSQWPCTRSHFTKANLYKMVKRCNVLKADIKTYFIMHLYNLRLLSRRISRRPKKCGSGVIHKGHPHRGVVSMRTGERGVIDDADVRKQYYIGQLKNTFSSKQKFFCRYNYSFSMFIIFTQEPHVTSSTS